jgi:hypothetical protein
MVDGKVLMHHGELLTLDERAIVERMRERDAGLPIQFEEEGEE